MKIPIEGEGAESKKQEKPQDVPSRGEESSALPEAGSKAEVTSDSQEVVEPKEADVEELQDRVLRLQAEFQNYKKRVERERARFREQAAAELIQQLLPALDSLEKAMGYSANRPEDDPLRQGVELMFSQLKEVLEREGLAEVTASGDVFDPEVHEAVMTVDVDDSAAERVVEELQKGYTFRGRLLRPAKVSVGKAKDSTA